MIAIGSVHPLTIDTHEPMLEIVSELVNVAPDPITVPFNVRVYEPLPQAQHKPSPYESVIVKS